jgi:hypothetical protein
VTSLFAEHGDGAPAADRYCASLQARDRHTTGLSLSPESSGGAIPVYPVRGVETPHGGVAGLNSAPRWVEEESQRWQIVSQPITKAMAWIVADS